MVIEAMNRPSHTQTVVAALIFTNKTINQHQRTHTLIIMHTRISRTATQHVWVTVTNKPSNYDEHDR